MGQELLLNVDVSTKSSSVSKKQTNDSSLEQSAGGTKPFSSTLDEQVEKQTIEQKESKIAARSSQSDKAKPSKNDDLSMDETVINDGQDGKVLPDDSDKFINISVSDKTDEVLSELEGDAIDIDVADEDKNIEPIDDVLVALPVEPVKMKVVADNNDELKTKSGSIIRNNAALKTQKTVELIKSSVVADESNEEVKGLRSEQKPVSALRSDILNALNKNTENDSKKVNIEGTVVKTEKTIAAQLLDKPLNGVRQMAEMLSQKKPELVLEKPTFDRHVSGLMTALSAPASFSAAATGVQASSAGQPVLALQPAIQSEAWGKVLSNRVVWMAREGVQQAELRLNPANLGPVEVKLHMSNDQANVTFLAQNAATRDALEQALPKLRESFQENGMELAHADVSDHAPEQDNDESDAEKASQMTAENTDDIDSKNESQGELIESGELELGKVSLYA